MLSALKAIVGWLGNLIGYLYDVMNWLLDGFLWILKMAVYFCFDGILTAIELFFSAMDFSAFVVSAVANWSGLPSQMIYLINHLAIPQGVTILIGAIVIRMGLNLIPAAFTRI